MFGIEIPLKQKLYLNENFGGVLNFISYHSNGGVEGIINDLQNVCNVPGSNLPKVVIYEHKDLTRQDLILVSKEKGIQKPYNNRVRDIIQKILGDKEINLYPSTESNGDITLHILDNSTPTHVLSTLKGRNLSEEVIREYQRAKDDGGYEVTFDDDIVDKPVRLGSGCMSILSFLIKCLMFRQCNPGDIVVLRHIDNHLNPGVQRRFFNFLKTFGEKNNILFVIEVYSPYMMDIHNRDNLRIVSKGFMDYEIINQVEKDLSDEDFMIKYIFMGDTDIPKVNLYQDELPIDPFLCDIYKQMANGELEYNRDRGGEIASFSKPVIK